MTCQTVREEDEELLVKLAMAGDRCAFAVLVETYRPGVRRAIGKFTRSREQLEDIEQETFLAALRALPALRSPEKFSGWLFTVARQKAMRASTREYRTGQLKVSSEILELVAAPADLQAEDWISDGVQALPEDFARPAVLHYLEGWPVSKIATDLSIPVTTVKWRLHRARQILRQRLAGTLD